MKSINWKIGIFWVTCVLSVLFGYLVVKKSALYSDIVRSISYQRMDVMLLPNPKPMSIQLYNSVEFLICFAVPFGLTWLLYFIVTRYLIRDIQTTNRQISKKGSLT